MRIETRLNKDLKSINPMLTDIPRPTHLSLSSKHQSQLINNDGPYQYNDIVHAAAFTAQSLLPPVINGSFSLLPCLPSSRIIIQSKTKLATAFFPRTRRVSGLSTCTDSSTLTHS